jgi:hypothetical protein
MFHIILEMEYIMPLILVLDMYYLVHCFQICLWVGVALPMLGTHTIEDQFLSMCIARKCFYFILGFTRF